MRRAVAIALSALLISVTSTTAELDLDASPLAHIQREARMLVARAPIAAHDVAGASVARRSVRVTNERNYAIAIRAGERIGVPAHVTAFHIDRESGGRADARNPTSSGTGLGQPVRCSQAIIIGRDCRTFSLSEHVRLAVDPEHNAKVTAAHIRACMDLMPGASPRDLWAKCHVKGHANVGGRIEMARAYFKPDASGWLTRGTTAQPWVIAMRTEGGA